MHHCPSSQQAHSTFAGLGVPSLRRERNCRDSTRHIMRLLSLLAFTLITTAFEELILVFPTYGTNDECQKCK
ncbi:hypothetical protein BDW72DRAFT_185826 [Aspergillus terricola var. indicus]